MINTPAAIAAQLRTALHDGDAATLAALLHPRVLFETLDPATPTADGSAAALAWYEDRRARGFRTHVEELFAYPATVVLGLRVTPPQADAGVDTQVLIYRLFRLTDDRVVRISDFTDRAMALDTAGAPFPPVR